jgi:hypothetical protein
MLISTTGPPLQPPQHAPPQTPPRRQRHRRYVVNRTHRANRMVAFLAQLHPVPSLFLNKAPKIPPSPLPPFLSHPIQLPQLTNVAETGAEKQPKV